MKLARSPISQHSIHLQPAILSTINLTKKSNHFFLWNILSFPLIKFTLLLFRVTTFEKDVPPYVYQLIKYNFQKDKSMTLKWMHFKYFVSLIIEGTIWIQIKIWHIYVPYILIYMYSLLDMICLHYYIQEAFALPSLSYNLSCFTPQKWNTLVINNERI